MKTAKFKIGEYCKLILCVLLFTSCSTHYQTTTYDIVYDKNNGEIKLTNGEIMNNDFVISLDENNKTLIFKSRVDFDSIETISSENATTQIINNNIAKLYFTQLPNSIYKIHLVTWRIN